MRSLMIASLAITAALAHGQEIVTLPTRAGGTQSYLLVAPKGDQPQAVAVLFPGGNGNIRLRLERDRIRFSSNNFLVRSRGIFTAHGVVAAVMDVPSDHQAEGMPNSFRKAEGHVADLRAVITDLKRRFVGAPVFLVGTSMGSVSTAYLSRALKADVAGAVLTANPFVESGRRSRHGDDNLRDFDLAGITIPLLLVQHRDDGCYLSPYRETRRRADKHPLISVSGGQPPISDPCEGQSQHGFLGKEAETVGAIVNWMLKKPFAREIN